jgi:hypothetical protein
MGSEMKILRNILALTTFNPATGWLCLASGESVSYNIFISVFFKLSFPGGESQKFYNTI